MTDTQLMPTIRPGTPEGDRLGLTKPRFGPKTYLYRDGSHIIFANLDIHDPQPRKVLHDLVVRTNDQGYIAVILSHAGDPVDNELLEWGFVLQSFPGSRGRCAYFRGKRGQPVVSARFEKYGASVSLTDEENDLGFLIKASTPERTLSIVVDVDGITVSQLRRTVK